MSRQAQNQIDYYQTAATIVSGTVTATGYAFNFACFALSTTATAATYVAGGISDAVEWYRATKPAIKLIEVKGRKKEGYEKNITASLSLDHKLLPDQAAKQIEKAIAFHALNRIDLFFYLLVAYYKKNKTIEMSKTRAQHGRGNSFRNTHACHSCFFPSVTDNASTSILDDTHLMNSMNMTVELPTICNDLDGHIEGGSQPSRCRKEALALLNQCSRGEITVEFGITQFVRFILEAITLRGTPYFKKQMKADAEKSCALLRVSDVARRATATLLGDDNQIVPRYVPMMLFCGKKIVYDEKDVLRVQNEILSCKSA